MNSIVLKNSITYFVISLSTFASPYLFGQSLSTILEKSSQIDPRIQQQAAKSKSSRNSYNKALYQHEPKLFASTGYQEKKDYGLSSSFIIDRTYRSYLQSGIQYTSINSGLSMKAGFEVDTFHMKTQATKLTSADLVSGKLQSTKISAEPAYNVPKLYSELTYPLWGDQENSFLRDKIYESDKNIDIQTLLANLVQNTVTIEWVKKYIAVHELQKKLELSTQQLKYFSELKRQTLSKFKNQLVDEDDVLKVQNNTLRKNQENLMIKNQLDLLKNEFTRLLSIESIKIENKSIENWAANSEKKAALLFYKNSPQYGISTKKIEQINNKIKIAKAKNDPKLDFKMRVSGKDKQESNGDTFEEDAAAEYTFALEFSKTIGEKSANSEIERLTNDKKSIEFGLDNERRLFNSLKQQAVKNNELYLAFIKLQGEVITSLEKRVRIERDKYRKARLNLTFLISTENELLDSKRKLVEYKSLRYLSTLPLVMFMKSKG